MESPLHPGIVLTHVQVSCLAQLLYPLSRLDGPSPFVWLLVGCDITTFIPNLSILSLFSLGNLGSFLPLSALPTSLTF